MNRKYNVNAISLNSSVNKKQACLLDLNSIFDVVTNPFSQRHASFWLHFFLVAIRSRYAQFSGQ